MNDLSLSTYSQSYLDGRFVSTFHDQDEDYRVISEFDYGSACFICHLCLFVEKVSLSTFVNGDYLLDGKVVTDSFLKEIKNVTRHLKDGAINDVFSCDNGARIFIKGHNDANFIYDGKDFSKNKDTMYCDYIRKKTLALPIQEFNPYIGAMIKAIQRLQITHRSLSTSNTVLQRIAKEMVDHFESDNDFPYQSSDFESISGARIKEILLYLLKEETERADFKKQLKNFHSLPAQNLRSLRRYIGRLFNRYARLLVLRIDLGYAKSPRNQMSESQALEEYHLAKSHRERLYANSRNNAIFDHLVGHVWKLEYGLDKGFHYHVMLFFDGSKVREDINLAKRIGDYWSKVVTNGEGVYWNCNANKDGYRNCGIGMINHFDHDRRNDLIEYAGCYLVKSDLFSRVIVRGNKRTGRTFGTGLVKDKDDNRGRPRSNGGNVQDASSSSVDEVDERYQKGQ